jgi:hypothetical protein
MRGRKTIYPITLTDEQKKHLQQLVKARKRRCVSGGHAGTKSKPGTIGPGLDGLGFFPPEVRAQVTAVACSRPEAEGVPLARWSYAEIVQRLVTLDVVVSIATSTIGRWLQAEQIKPWRYHLWQHVRDPRFLELAKPVLRLPSGCQPIRIGSGALLSWRVGGVYR